MASVAMTGGAIANALAFTGRSYLFYRLSADSIDAERKRHDAAIEKLQAAQIEWTHKHQQRIDFINNQLRLEGKCCQEAFKDTPLLAYRCPKNLCDFLVKAKLKQSTPNNANLPKKLHAAMMAVAIPVSSSLMAHHPILSTILVNKENLTKSVLLFQ